MTWNKIKKKFHCKLVDVLQATAFTIQSGLAYCSHVERGLSRE